MTPLKPPPTTPSRPWISTPPSASWTGSSTPSITPSWFITRDYIPATETLRSERWSLVSWQILIFCNILPDMSQAPARADQVARPQETALQELNKDNLAFICIYFVLQVCTSCCWYSKVLISRGSLNGLRLFSTFKPSLHLFLVFYPRHKQPWSNNRVPYNIALNAVQKARMCIFLKFLLLVCMHLHINIFS